MGFEDIMRAWRLVARAQKSTIPLIGFLSSGSLAQWTSLIAAFRQGLNEVGYVETKNVAIEFRWADGNYARLPSQANELVRSQIAVLVATGGTTSALAAKAATSTVPIVLRWVRIRSRLASSPTSADRAAT